MDGLKLLTVVFVMFNVVDAAAVPCTWTQFRLQHLNERSIELLRTMGPPMPLQCLEKAEIGCPKDAFQEAQNIDVAVLALETLRGVKRIFMNDQTSVTWDQENLRNFNHIVSSRQIENIQKCVGEDVLQSADSSLGKLRSFFDKVEENLKTKGFSECAWEVAREEVRRGLQKFDEFLKSRS